MIDDDDPFETMAQIEAAIRTGIPQTPPLAVKLLLDRVIEALGPDTDWSVEEHGHEPLIATHWWFTQRLRAVGSKLDKLNGYLLDCDLTELWKQCPATCQRLPLVLDETEAKIRGVVAWIARHRNDAGPGLFKMVQSDAGFATERIEFFSEVRPRLAAARPPHTSQH
jgi:hypothetical protein